MERVRPALSAFEKKVRPVPLLVRRTSNRLPSRDPGDGRGNWRHAHRRASGRRDSLERRCERRRGPWTRNGNRRERGSRARQRRHALRPDRHAQKRCPGGAVGVQRQRILCLDPRRQRLRLGRFPQRTRCVWILRVGEVPGEARQSLRSRRTQGAGDQDRSRGRPRRRHPQGTFRRSTVSCKGLCSAHRTEGPSHGAMATRDS